MRPRRRHLHKVEVRKTRETDAASDVVVVVGVVALLFRREKLHPVEFVEQQILDAFRSFPLQRVGEDVAGDGRELFGQR